MRRRSLRILKSYDTYTIKTGSAGFVQLFINSKRVQPKNITKTFTVRKNNRDIPRVTHNEPNTRAARRDNRYK